MKEFTKAVKMTLIAMEEMSVSTFNVMLKMSLVSQKRIVLSIWIANREYAKIQNNHVPLQKNVKREKAAF